ncbi:MAG TPA: hypothetical protein PL151_06660 [Phycisphaerae bacterium]|nr:hypothetical protein [Phycisphaerae bacterium]HOJ72423.1 hypothetical protein [Phycisphaerae bacterium]HOM49915.1 hypothetical protein [Phycisphaerae bacterium]HOQ88398.1 hypothetical protein [Phycisphaerae bacterium]HPP26343.1 hypothetical protein [Phycisphaerae bacterium]
MSNPLIFDQKRLDKYVGGLLGPLTTTRLRAMATLIGMRHFQDFLLSVNLIDQGAHRRAMQMCDRLWPRITEALADAAPDYAFLDKYR